MSDPLGDPGAGSGRVYLVGAGPGDPGLVTRRGLELIRSCDVILYDRLAAPELVDEAPPGAERIFVGKTPDEPSIPQARIDALLADNARSGKKVVRLKGGDPYVFGRGADEVQALAAAGIAFEVVSGVTSAVAAPAYAGISLTYPGTSSSFTVMTAHGSADRPDAGARWNELARGADTLVLLMGVTPLPEITRRLIEAGRSPEEPSAVIEWGTLARQRVVSGPLERIAELAREARIKPPATTVVGEVVRLRGALDWFTTRPLFGRRIVVTRARSDATGLVEALRELGADVLLMPTIEIADPPSYGDLDRAATELAAGAVDWVVFPSVHGVERLFDRMASAGLDARAFGSSRVAAVGPATERALVARGIRPDLVPETFTGKALAEALGEGGGTVLLPRPLEAPRDIVDDLSAAGWKVHEVVAYQTVIPKAEEPAAAAVRDRAFDAVTFTSGSAARNFCALFGDPNELGLGASGPGPLVACIGPSTADAARAAGFRVDVVAGEHTTEGLISAVVERVGRA